MGGGGGEIDELKTEKKNPQDKHYQTSERTRLETELLTKTPKE